MEFRHRGVELSVGRISDIRPLEKGEGSRWLALVESGALMELDLDAVTSRIICQPKSTIEGSLRLHVSSCERYCAIAERRGSHGVILDLEQRKETFRLNRGDSHVKHCEPSIAFFDHHGRTLLVHATAWNRLDISDPATGELLTSRQTRKRTVASETPEHYLDYFHCGLTISPTAEWIADNGWIWHPLGRIRVWSLRDWVNGNVWESEDGPSIRTYCNRDYVWDAPICWTNANTLAVWGLRDSNYGEHDWDVIPGVRLFDVAAEDELPELSDPDAAEGVSFFRNDADWMCFDHFLFVISEKRGAQVWDTGTRSKLYHDRKFCPISYHGRTKTFLSIADDSALILSRLTN